MSERKGMAEFGAVDITYIGSVNAETQEIDVVRGTAKYLTRKPDCVRVQAYDTDPGGFNCHECFGTEEGEEVGDCEGCLGQDAMVEDEPNGEGKYEWEATDVATALPANRNWVRAAALWNGPPSVCGSDLEDKED